MHTIKYIQEGGDEKFGFEYYLLFKFVRYILSFLIFQLHICMAIKKLSSFPSPLKTLQTFHEQAKKITKLKSKK